MTSEETSLEPVSTQAIILNKDKVKAGFKYILKYIGPNIADRLPNSLITSEGMELPVSAVVDVYAAAKTIEAKRIVSVLQVVGLADANQQILFDGSRDDPNYEDTTTALQPSVALVGLEARLNMYDRCGVDPMRTALPG